PLLVGWNEDQFSFYPTLQHVVVGVVAATERKRAKRHYPQASELHFHVALLGAKSSSTCVFIILRTSSGSKRSNSPLQMIATKPGAAIICGKSASPSCTSPRAAPRRSSARTAAIMRANTSR